MVEMPFSGLKAAEYWHPSNSLHCVAARSRPLFSSAADGSIALTDGHLDMVCMSKYMYKSLYGSRGPSRGVTKATSGLEYSGNRAWISGVHDKLSNSANTPHKDTVKKKARQIQHKT